MTGEKHSKRQEGKRQKILMQSHARRLLLCACTSPQCQPGSREFTLLFVSPEACTPCWRGCEKPWFFRLWQVGKAPFGVHLSTTLPYNSMHRLSQPPALHSRSLDTRPWGGPASPLAQAGPSAVQGLVLPCRQCGSSLLSAQPWP